ncbi:hypothetical protein [Sorangium sp. So ce1024]|uniref:hypothetical protein n=1 Tax=Sorangium sp. So ce1024 TaxID=3133327 RepID=UPI003F024799
MSRIRRAPLSRRENLIALRECADVLCVAADELEHEAHCGRFDFMAGADAARYIADAFRRTAPGYIKRSRLRQKGAKR